VRSIEDFLVELREHDPGDEVTVEVVRDADERSLDVVLGERPDD
jgi:S1-C subfamily serine protease